MAKRPRINPDDLDRRSVTDLKRYREAKELEKRRKPPKPPGQSFLGSNPRAGLIVVVVLLLAAAFYLLPLLPRLF